MVQVCSLLALLSILASLGRGAKPQTHNVNVGPGLTFQPSSLEAAVGDHINFHFYSGEHSVAQSTFAAPCVPSGPNAIFSGFVVPSGGEKVASMMFSMRVNSTAPIWLYCSRTVHCELGMSMVVNPPLASTGHTLEMYRKASQNTKGKSPTKVFGGVLVPNKGSAKRDAEFVVESFEVEA